MDALRVLPQRFSVTRGIRIAIIALLMCSAAVGARGYVLEGPSWPAGSVIVLQLGLGTPAKLLQDGSPTWDAAVAPALAQWNNNVGRLQITSVSGVAALGARSGDGINSILWGTTAFGQSFGAYTLAITLYRWSGSSTMTEMDTVFNSAQKFDSYRGALQFPGPGTALADIRRVFLHEVGHGIGLNHPDSAGQHVDAVMNSITSNTETLAADDLNGAHSLYGTPVISTPTPTPAPTATPTPTPTATPTTTSHLANISTRMNVGLNDEVLIGGFIVRGSQPKTVIIRALGPSLNVAGKLADPYLELHDSSGAGIASNDDWQSGTQAAQLQASGVAPTHPNEAAMIVTLQPGSYTAIVDDAYQLSSGVAMVEVYEYDSNSTRLVNISTRGRVGVADQALIGGFIVQGGTAKKLIVRALGPSLAGAVSAPLADPTLELRDANGNLFASNNNWQDSQAGAIQATGVAPTNPSEAAIVTTMNGGNYTAVVRGQNNGVGVGMVEVFDLDP